MSFPGGFLWGAGTSAYQTRATTAGVSRCGPRFGLVHVDYATGVRTIKDSGRYYAKLIAGGGTAPDLPRIEAFG
ncbi:family 1 glycosylhydrolase [Nonomuraea basaltis]|uniref:family 1 glycosylhydrolase n=1 Tax=Nonomuraea basaltis TaxID=2495887 RepID=UPI00197DA03E|nr:family 1 glycosylhydrolase [Nonomuraea basaltis]